jgi:hypothetical protein
MRVQSPAVPACGQSDGQLFFVRVPIFLDSVSAICHMLRQNKSGSAGCSMHLAEPNQHERS